MAGIHELRLKAELSRQTGYAAPIVTSVDEARRLATEIADQIAGLPPRERLLMLTHLDDVYETIQVRLSKLQDELQDTRLRIAATNGGAAACVRYAAASALRPWPAGSR